MRGIRRSLFPFILIVAVATGGCTFGVFPREPGAPTLAAIPPCYGNDVCGVPYDSFGFGWTSGAMRSATGR